MSTFLRVLWLGLAAVVVAMLSGGCGQIKSALGLGRDVTTETIAALDDAIDAVGNASIDLQKALADAQKKLTADAQATIRNEIATIASRSIAQAGVEIRCEADFIRNRVRQALVRLKAKFLGQAVPPVEPGLCQVTPIAVDRESVPDHVKMIELYGYDFDQTPGLRIFHETASGRQDVSAMLDRPTHYAMTLKFGGNGVQLTDQSRRFVVDWQGNVISTIAVIQPQTPVCQMRVTPLEPGRVTFVPPHTRGDGDFAGHGPAVTATVTISSGPQEVKALVYMRATETRSDWTTAEGSRPFLLYTVPPGWRIDKVEGNLVSSTSYVDSNHDEDKFELGSGGPVKRFIFVGDKDGDEAGTRTKVDVDFNRLSIEETQTGDCVSPRAVQTLQDKGLIRAVVFERLSPSALNILKAAKVNQ